MARAHEPLTLPRAELDRLRAAHPDMLFTLTASGGLVLERAADGSRPNTCPSCALNFPRPSDAARHFQTAHARDTLPFVCVASCSARAARTNRRDRFINHLRRNAGSCTLAFLCELAKDPVARDADLVATVAALFPATDAAAPAPSAAVLLVRDVGFDAISAGLREIAADAVPAGLPHPLSLDAFGITRVMIEAAGTVKLPLITPPASPRPRRQLDAGHLYSSREPSLSAPTPPTSPPPASLLGDPALDSLLVYDAYSLYPWDASNAAGPWSDDLDCNAPAANLTPCSSSGVVLPADSIAVRVPDVFDLYYLPPAAEAGLAAWPACAAR
ncbi:hypothetical protein H9P43_003943 [Blastocladiella emersonii ATCC 22665]|nr:hypothetical protein H9P43_003943 [Blastocladiella emersonii ATCC 22665]